MHEVSYKPSSSSTDKLAKKASSKESGLKRWWGDLPPRHQRVVMALLAIVGVLVVISIVVGLFSRTPSFTGNDVAIQLEVPTEVKVGEVFDGVIRITNNELDALETVDITLSAPTGFTLRSSNRTTNTPGVPGWQVGRVESGAVYEIQFQGVIQAEAGSGVELQARLSYSPESVSSSFGADVATTILLTQSDVSLATTLPGNVSPGGELTYEVVVRSQGELPLEDAAVKLDLPTGFRIIESSPVATNRRDVWELGTLSDEEQTIEVRGVLNGEAGEEYTFVAQVGVLDSDGVFAAQEERTDIVRVVDASMELDVTVNGLSSASVSAASEIEVALEYRNAGEDTLRNVQLEVEASGSDALLNLADWQVDRGQRQGLRAVFTPGTLPELAQLDAGDEGRLLFTIRLPEGAELDRGTKNLSFTFTPRATTTVSGVSSVRIDTEGAPASVKVGTGTTLEAEAVYYDVTGVPLGDGPIPPQVGERTTYIVRATLRNTTSIVNNVNVQFRLANGVELVEAPTVSDGSVNTSLRRITWQLGRLGTEVGAVLPGVTISFPVRVRPSGNDVGSHMPLVSGITLTGTDGFTQLPVSLEVSEFDTSIPTDAIANEQPTRVRE